MNILQKGIFQLKRLLFYNPDINNDLEKPDLEEFTGLSLDFNIVQKNNLEQQEFVKSVRQSTIKQRENRNTRDNMKTVRNLKKNSDNNSTVKNVKNGTLKINEKKDNKETIEDKEKMVVKKKLRIRITEEEIRLLQKIKDIKNNK